MAVKADPASPAKVPGLVRTVETHRFVEGQKHWWLRAVVEEVWPAVLAEKAAQVVRRLRQPVQLFARVIPEQMVILAAIPSGHPRAAGTVARLFVGVSIRPDRLVAPAARAN